jgi:3'-phosphoadenosine 5'-phosphosulfate sulfotransferase (PAPS reductase)/FAD synthetase
MKSPYLITEPTCISFSGGRTSAYMLWRVLQSNGGLPDEAIVCFKNTGKEEEATLEFVRDCSVKWNVPITWLEYVSDEPKFIEVSPAKFKIVDFETASRNGEPFEQLIRKRKYLPNQVARFCTSELKVLTIDRYLSSIGIDEYCTMVGIRADEPRRVAKMRNNKDEKVMPLAEDGITEAMVWDWWDNNNFDLGLPKGNGLSNCDLCFQKGGSIITSLIIQKPERAVWWAKMENEVGATFRSDRPSYSQMLQYTKDQMPLFEDSTIECFCGD